MFPAISPNRDFVSPSQAQDVILEQVNSSNPMYITPYVVGGYSQTAQPNHAGTAFHRRDESAQNLGLDAKYNLTGNLTLDLTVNTDFAQAEADNQEINLPRFSLFFPEKRQFFQERASIFEFKISLHAFVQYNSAADLIATNARFRYNLREGNDLWVVYNEDLNAERERNELILPRTNDRAVLLKYTHTFVRM